MSNTYGNQGFMSYMSYRPQAQELSESRYNLTIGATLTWGFGLNYLMLTLLGPRMLNIMYGVGGLELMTYNYTDAEWTDFVASMGGTLSYE